MRIKHGNVKFGFRDTYGVHHTLRPIIHDWLVNFKKTIQEVDERGGCIGVPGNIMSDFGIHWDDDGSYSEDRLKDGMEKWYEVLDEMIYGFSEEPPIPDNVGFSVRTVAEHDNGMTEITIDIDNQGAYDSYLERKRQFYERAEKGRELFAKYFENLWW